MIKTFLMAAIVTSAFSCINNPVKYHPPRRNSPVIKKESVAVPKASSVQSSTVALSQNSPAETSSQGVSTAAIPSPVIDAPEIKPPPPPIQVEESHFVLLNILKNPQTSRNKAIDSINSEEVLKSIETALEQSNTVPAVLAYKAFLLNRAAEISLDQRQHNQAMEFYRALISQFPQSQFAAKANADISVIQAFRQADARVIGAILPLTGKNANIGQHALNSIRMALGLNKPNSKFRLALFDSQGTPELARVGIDKLIRDDKAIAVIGGLSSREALAAGERADLFGVPFIGLSQKSGLTQAGEYIFRNSLTPEMQVDRLVQYATEKLSAKRFGILYPNDAYGVEFANIFWDHVLARGGSVTAAQTFDPKTNDFTDVVQKLVGTFHVDARQEEYKARLKEIALEKKEKAEKNKAKSSRANEVRENILPPIIDFDVLFIPDTGKTLGQVMAFMKVNDVPQMTYLGTNIWNSPDLAKRVGTHTSTIFFIDAIDLNDASVRETGFYKEYMAEYNQEPTLIEMQAYESAKIIRNLIGSDSTTREALANNLRHLGRSSGVTGDLRMSAQRELQRPLHILSLDSGSIKKVE